MEYIEKGSDFFQRGTQANPDNINLWANIGALWSSPFKRPDHERAARAWKEAAYRGENPVYKRRYMYSLCQIRGRERDALAEAQMLYEKDPLNLRYPTFRVLYWVLHQNPTLPPDVKIPTLEEIFETKKKAYIALCTYYYRMQKEDFYNPNIEQTLSKLIEELDVPDKYNPFRTPGQVQIPSAGW